MDLRLGGLHTSRSPSPTGSLTNPSRSTRPSSPPGSPNKRRKSSPPPIGSVISVVTEPDISRTSSSQSSQHSAVTVPSPWMLSQQAPPASPILSVCNSLEPGGQKPEHVDLSTFYGPVLLGDFGVCTPQGQVMMDSNHIVDRTAKEYGLLSQHLNERMDVIFNNILKSVEDKFLILKLQKKFKSDNYSDLAIQAYQLWKKSPGLVELALLQISFLYVHDDIRDDKRSIFFGAEALVTVLNRELRAYFESDASHEFKFSKAFKEQVYEKINEKYPQKINEIKIKTDTTLNILEVITTNYIQKAKKLVSKLDDSLDKGKIEKHLVSEMFNYFEVNIDEAKKNEKDSEGEGRTYSLDSYVAARTANSGVPVCLSLGSVLDILNNRTKEDGPTHAAFMLNKQAELQEGSLFRNVVDHTVMGVSKVNDVFSAIREAINNDLNMVAIHAENNKKPEAAFAQVADESNNHLTYLRQAYQCIVQQNISSIRKHLESGVESSKKSWTPEEMKDKDNRDAYFKSLVLKKLEKNADEGKIIEFLEEYDPQVRFFLFCSHWHNGNIAFSLISKRYKGDEGRLTDSEGQLRLPQGITKDVLLSKINTKLSMLKKEDAEDKKQEIDHLKSIADLCRS